MDAVRYNPVPNAVNAGTWRHLHCGCRAEPDRLRRAWSALVVQPELTPSSSKTPGGYENRAPTSDRRLLERARRGSHVCGIDAHCAAVGAPVECARVCSRSSSSSRQRIDQTFFKQPVRFPFLIRHYVGKGVFLLTTGGHSFQRLPLGRGQSTRSSEREIRI